MKYIILLTMLMCQLPAFAFVTYGNDGDCDFDSSMYSIQEIIDGSDDEGEIRVTNQEVWNENLSIYGKNLNLFGGYNSCALAAINHISSTKTTIDGNQLDTVIAISTINDVDISIEISGFRLTNGKSYGFNNGGAISAYELGEDVISIILQNVLMDNNQGVRGGAIYMKGNQVFVNMFDTMLINNKAYGNAGGSALGGGLYCTQGRAIINSGSGIHNNDAYSTITNAGKGGGMYLTDGCITSVYSGTSGGILDFRGISGNSASSSGGGVFITNGSSLRLLSTAFYQPININHNYADSTNNGIGDGGGLYVTGEGSSIIAEGVLLNNNRAQNGGGAAIYDGAVFLMQLPFNDCWDISNCNEVANNQTNNMDGLGGAFYNNTGFLSVSHSRLHNNHSNQGVVLYAENLTTNFVYRSMVYENGNHENNDRDGNFVYQVETNGYLAVQHSTTAFNPTTEGTIKVSGGDLNIQNSIFFEETTDHMAVLTDTTNDINCIMVDNNMGLGQASNVFIDNPLFKNEIPGQMNLHLQSNSPAIDICQEVSSQTVNFNLDIDGEDITDIQTVPNHFGIYDIGADEYFNDKIFKHSFEGT